MGKKLIIKGANFYANRIDTSGFDPTEWFVNAIDSVSRNIPIGDAVGLASILEPRTETGMVAPSGAGMTYYGAVSNLTSPRFCTKQMVSLKPLYDNGYNSIKLTPKTTGTLIAAYSDTPSVSSVNPFDNGKWNYNSNTSQATIPINANTCILIVCKSPTDDTSITTTGTITDWLDVSFD